MSEPVMKSYAVFVARPPKEDGKQFYTAMEIDYTQSEEDVEVLIANHVNERRVTPLPPGLINFMIFSADTAQEAANAARDEGLSYLSVDEMKRIKAAGENAKKFGQSAQARHPHTSRDDFDAARAEVDKAFAEAEDAFEGLFGRYRDPFRDANHPSPRR